MFLARNRCFDNPRRIAVFVLDVRVICVKSLVFSEADAKETRVSRMQNAFSPMSAISLSRIRLVSLLRRLLSPACRHADYGIALSPTVHDDAVFINERPAQSLSVPPEYEISSSLCHACLTSPRPVVILSLSLLLLLPSLNFPTRT